MSTASQPQAHNPLAAARARRHHDHELDRFSAPADLPDDSPEEAAEVVQLLRAALRPMSPSQAFAEQLRAELVAGPASPVRRGRLMPMRLSAAAIVALVAGCVWFVLRRLFASPAAQDMQEEAAVSPL